MLFRSERCIPMEGNELTVRQRRESIRNDSHGPRDLLGISRSGKQQRRWWGLMFIAQAKRTVVACIWIYRRDMPRGSGPIPIGAIFVGTIVAIRSKQYPAVPEPIVAGFIHRGNCSTTGIPTTGPPHQRKYLLLDVCDRTVAGLTMVLQTREEESPSRVGLLRKRTA